MNLDATTKSIIVVLAGAKTSENCDVTASYVDNGAAATLGGSNDTVTNGTAPVIAVSPPAPSVERTVQEVLVFNADSVEQVVSIDLVVSGTPRVIQFGTIQPGQTLIYTAPPAQRP
jgi:hypothetical protein